MPLAVGLRPSNYLFPRAPTTPIPTVLVCFLSKSAHSEEEKEDAAPKEVAPPQLDWTEEELKSKFDDKFNGAMNDIMLDLVSRTDDFSMNCLDVLKEAEIAGRRK